MFKTGQKVVCAIAFEGRYRDVITYPIKDKFYHVRGYTPNGTGLLLKEIKNKNFDLSSGINSEPGFAPHKFRSVDETFTEETLANLIEWNETKKVTV